MAEVLDFGRAPDLAASRLKVPPAGSVTCGLEGPADYEDRNQLAAKTAQDGWRTGALGPRTPGPYADYLPRSPAARFSPSL